MTRIRTWLIRRAIRTPYYHLEGYMARWWLFGGSARDTDRPAWAPPREWKGSRLGRWIGRWVAGRIHLTKRSDADRHFHDHPCASISVILWGGYWEVMPERQDQPPAADVSRYVRKWRGPGAVVFRRARSRHRLELPDGESSISLFIMGPKTNEWGFYTAFGKIPWREYLGVA